MADARSGEMDPWTDGGGWVDGWGGWVNGWGWMGRRVGVDKRQVGWWMGRRVGGWMDRWMDQWMGGGWVRMG